jgi:hypothetical protein
MGEGPGVSAPAWARPYQSAGPRAEVAIILVAGSALGFAMLAVQAVFGPALTLPARSLPDRVAVLELGLGSLIAFTGLVGGAIAVPIWAHRSYRNLPTLGHRGHLSPRWATACWLIPVVNLALPWVVLHDLWSASTQPPPGRLPLPALWWATWLAAAGLWLLNTAGARLAGFAGVLEPAALALAGLLLVLTIHAITHSQELRTSSG